jgi:hypothetical protein
VEVHGPSVRPFRQGSPGDGPCAVSNLTTVSTPTGQIGYDKEVYVDNVRIATG